MAMRPRLFRRPPAAVPTPGAEDFHGLARRHTAARVLLAAAGLGLALAGVAFARDLDPQQSAFLPKGRNAVVVLDLSKSVEARAYRRVGRVLKDIVSSDEPVGLIIFSDAPYEVLPPGSPAVNVKPFLRYFTPVGKPGSADEYIANPWQDAFSAGTRASTALELARQTLADDGVKEGSVVFVSDLDLPVSDVPDVTRALTRMRSEGILLRVIPLFPTSDNRYVFERLAGPGAFVRGRSLYGGEGGGTGIAQTFTAPSPDTLLLVAGLIILLVAFNERWCGRLEFRFSPMDRRARW